MRQMTIGVLKAPLFYLVIFLITRGGFAQTGYFTVTGSVINEMGALQQGVQVIFTSTVDPRKLIEYDIAASGVFSVSLLANVPYNLRIMAYGYPLQYYDPTNPQVNADGPPAARLIFSGSDSMVIHITMTPRQISAAYGVISGRVIDSLGPVNQAVVTIMEPGKDVVGQTSTDITGQFACTIPAQPQIVSVSRSPYPLQFWGRNGTSLSADTQNMLMVLPSDTTVVTMLLRSSFQTADSTVGSATGQISGIVQTSDGKPLAAMNVFLSGNLGSGAMAFTDSLGKFSFYNVAQDIYCVAVNADSSYAAVNGKICQMVMPSGGTISGIVLIMQRSSPVIANYQQLWASAFINDTGDLLVTCTAGSGLFPDTVILYSQNRFEEISALATFIPSAQQTHVSWKEQRPWSQSLFTYVFVGKGKAGAVRSNTAGYNPAAGRTAAPDSLAIALYTDRYGVRVVIRADSSSEAITGLDTMVLYRKSATEDWASVCKVWGNVPELWDVSFDKTKDLGKTVSYKVETTRGGIVTKRSPEIQFTATQEFFSHFGNYLSVGQNQTYKTIQQAIDAAQNYDRITVNPGVYQENVDLKGKIVSINGNWTGGVPPVIDALGGVAITAEYPAQGQGPDMISIQGLKIINATVGVKTFAGISLGQCLFANIVQKAVSAATDSVSMAAAAMVNPFVVSWVQNNIYQCTFIGRPGGYALSAVSQSAAIDSALMTGFAIGPSVSISVNNSIFALYATASFPALVQGANSGIFMSNCDFWQSSQSPNSGQVTLNPGVFTTDPKFIDTINYFLPDTSALRTLSLDGNSIGYDQERFWSNGQVSLPPLSTVTGMRKTVTGAHSITITWNKSPAAENVGSYIVYRALGYDSLFFVNAFSQWEPLKSNDSVHAVLDSFVTKDSMFVDSSVKVGVPYVYAVVATTPDGNRSNVILPYPPALSSYTVEIQSPTASGVYALTHREAGFTTICLCWNRPLIMKSAHPAYSICRIRGVGASVNASDSSSIRQLVRSLVSGAPSVDSFSTADTTFIDKTAMMDTGYLYVVTVADTAKTMAERPLAWVSAKIDRTVFKARQPLGIKANQWNMIGPWARGSLSFSAPSSVVVYHWDDATPQDKLMSSYVQSTQMNGATGYWFMSAVDTVISVDSSMFGQLMMSRDSIAIHLTNGQSGWTQIASPFPFSVKPAWLGASGFTAYEWAADSAQYREALSLDPWKAYWLHCDRDTNVVIHASDVVIDSMGSALAKKTRQAPWELRVAFSGSGRDPDNFIGVIAPSSSQEVRLESLKPPQAFNYPQLYFVQPGKAQSALPARLPKLAKLYKTSSAIPNQKLEWMVGISASSKPGTIRISGIETAPEKLFLFWVSASSVVDLKSAPEISIPAHSAAVYGYIVATANPKDIALYTARFELRKSYPNPFSKSATVEFSIPYAWNPDGSKKDGETRDVSLCIYNLSGRKVASLVKGALSVGEHRLAWNGKSENGGGVAAGVYIARLISGDSRKAMTMMKVK